MDENLDRLIRDTKEKATQYLIETHNCAYSPFKAMAEALNIPLNIELEGLPIGFAGGISGSGHICGALWASIAVIGMYLKKTLKENKEKNFFLKHISIHLKSSEAYRRFVKMFGSPNCGDLNPGLDLVSEEQLKKCTALVRKSIEITFNVLFSEE